jgi:hypothetical protein
MARPEGALLALFMFFSILYAKRHANPRDLIISFCLIFMLLGTIYFVWRWVYFGFPLPNPFYKKGGGHLYWTSLRRSLHHTFDLTFPFNIPLLIVGLSLLGNCISTIARSMRSVFTDSFANKEKYSLIPICGFAVIWVLLSDEMNYLMRLQYPIVAMVLMSWFPLVEEIFVKLRFFGDNGGYKGITALEHISAAVLFSAAIMFQYTICSQYNINQQDGRYAVARIMSDYQKERYTLASAEAGLLPLYSGWRSLDAWGLNDSWITHNGGVTEEYLDKYRPEIIMFKAFFSPITPAQGAGKFYETVKTLERYSEKHDYILAASFGISAYETHYYFIKRDFQHAFEIANRISEADYYWYKTGERCVNYARLRSNPLRP